eukprot:SAG31_NODE_47723_length_223_cov_14.919355_1_plen_31_part_01
MQYNKLSTDGYANDMIIPYSFFNFILKMAKG